ncbi:MAG: gene transfer agent family protein [Mesorhizobium sp.]
MSRDGSITADFGTGGHRFRLAWGEIVQLQDERDAGPYEIMDRLISGRWRVQDIACIIRLGLVGGGMRPPEAIRLVREYVEARPPMENHDLALRVLGAALVGAPEEDVGKKSAAENQDGESNRTSLTENSDFRPSTAMEQ